MINQKINFKSQREIGEILSDTFKFIRLEYKGLFKALMRNAGIPFLILLAATGYYAATATDFNFLATGGAFAAGGIVLGLSILGIATMLYYGFMFGTVLHYIKNYIEGPTSIDQQLISKNVRSDLGSIIGLTILSFLMTIIGFMLCFLPGVYLFVPLTLVYALYIFRNLSVGNSITESFSLVKNEWWSTFFAFIVIYIIVYLIGLVFQIPLLIYTFFSAFTKSQEVSGGDMSQVFDWVYVTLNVISSAASYLFYTIVVIASAFIYFNLNEKKNQTGTLERIDSIGNDL
ncbi:hypothetical protein [Flavimarina sp. Hel_I_48]|uniref:hypothetical protein n=1 Tax=Flavimarina sp. Hel_I_48 TaxID=1392488 RepID=UPI0004DF5C07|nr:hypothetical protein [Flavimarina sp. Hel_I_48]